MRAASNIDEDKKTKNALREVIIAGVDGVIRFIDLEDGSLTRGAINLGYPMKGSPSLHPAGYPYMSVGQYTRKMKVKTGKIGLRQYNLYNQKELTLIDGLDGKMHRGINKYGSFETSALIDRTSDTMITLGTNGLLYLTSLNTEFDYQAGTLKTTPGSIVMASRAKGEKKDEEAAAKVLYTITSNNYGFEGMALAEDLEKLKGLDVVTEMPTLSQICVAVMKHNSKLYTGSIL